jgi:CheY-like chemotaxis protein
MPLPPILYVEDDENDVLFMKRAFARAGIAPPLHIAGDGKEAIDYLKAAGENGQLPSLVLLDLNLPLVSGFEVLQWIRSRPEFQSVPVFIFTSSAHESDIAKTRQAGANDYAVKPASPSRLDDLVLQIKERWLGESQARTADQPG